MSNGDSRYHFGLDSSLIGHRGKHDTVVVEPIKSAGRVINSRVFVWPDSRLIKSLEDDTLWDAYKDIHRAANAIVSGMGLKASDPSRVRGSGEMSDDLAILIEDYFRWYANCTRLHLAPLLVKRMVLEGATLNGMDNEYGFYKGSCKIKVWQCLEMWEKTPS